jgi:hypothetical protein
MKKLHYLILLIIFTFAGNAFAADYEFVAINWAGSEFGRFSTMDQCQWWIKGHDGASCLAVLKK